MPGSRRRLGRTSSRSSPSASPICNLPSERSAYSSSSWANVELDANGVRLVAPITVEAVRDLGLAVGSEVTAAIKASEVILATGG
ncbi:MAG TPA: TOBE domain-containing protein [Streptosporangiaceae bacterium]|nr:TOBE domain-containing protein [Streptosporangiaceae bacterium]